LLCKASEANFILRVECKLIGRPGQRRHSISLST
jgi:hypothetical protein